MKTVRWGAAVGALVAAVLITSASCGDDDDDGQAAAQVDPDPLNLEIQSVTIPPGEPARPVVRFRVTDAAGAPVDLAAEIGAANTTPPGVPRTVPRFTLAALDDRGNYTSLYANTVNPRAYTFEPPDGQTLPPAAATTQATSQPPSRNAAGQAQPWPVADLVSVGGGVYELTMPETNVPGIDRSRTHTLAGWVVRNRTTLDTDIAHSSLNFIPGGTGTVARDEVITDAACNRCHGTLQAHGTRRGTQLCITCHSPQTGDPETSRTVDFQVMIHKIHMGRDLPSARQGEPYFIVGNSQSIHDYSEVAFPWHDHGVQHCSVCHTGGEDSENWRTMASITTCTSCHDNVQFEAGAAPVSCSTLTPATAFQDCVHTAGPIAVSDPDDVSSCQACHGAGAPNAIDRYHHGD